MAALLVSASDRHSAAKPNPRRRWSKSAVWHQPPGPYPTFRSMASVCLMIAAGGCSSCATNAREGSMCMFHTEMSKKRPKRPQSHSNIFSHAFRSGVVQEWFALPGPTAKPKYVP